MGNKNIKESFKSFTPEKKDKERMFNNILAKIEYSKEEEKSLTIIRRLRPSILIAAMLIFVLTTVTFATIYLELDTKFLNFLNPSSNEQAEYLANGAYTIDKQIRKKNGTLDIKQVIGDDNTTLILMEFIAPKGTVLNKNHYRFEDTDISFGTGFAGYGIISLKDDNVNDNKISLVMRVKTNESLMGQKFHLKLTDLGSSSTFPGELTTVLSGIWKTSFKLDFKNYSTDYKVDRTTKFFDYDATIKTISISPISIAIKLESPFVKEISNSSDWKVLGLDEYSDPYPITINYKDGTIETTDIFKGMHHLDSNGEMLLIKTFDNVINDKEIKSITFLETIIPIND